MTSLSLSGRTRTLPATEKGSLAGLLNEVGLPAVVALSIYGRPSACLLGCPEVLDPALGHGAFLSPVVLMIALSAAVLVFAAVCSVLEKHGPTSPADKLSWRLSSLCSGLAVGLDPSLPRSSVGEIRGSISRLLTPSRPSAILGAVVSVIVNSLNGKAFRPRPHVLAEGSKAIPSVTYRYSPAPVSDIGRVIGVQAPLPHRRPHIVDRISVLSSCVTMLGFAHDILLDIMVKSLTKHIVAFPALSAKAVSH